MVQGILPRGHVWIRILAAAVTALALPLAAGNAAAAGVSPSQPISADGSTLHVLALGPDIYGNNDVFSYLYTTASGDGTWEVEILNDPIITPVDQNAHECNKAGLMVRATLDPDSPMFDLVQTACQGGVATFFRANKGDNVQGTTPGNMTFGPNTAAPEQKLPVWIKLQKKGDMFTSSISYDGTTWPYAQTLTPKVALPSTYYIGIAANAHSNTQFSQFDFSGIQGLTPTNYIAVGTKGSSPVSVTVPSAVLQATAAAAPASSNTAPAASATTATTTQLPKTGGSPFPMIAGIAMLGAGCLLLRGRQQVSKSRS